MNQEEFISKDELFEWINNELKYENTQKTQRNKGYFDALKKIKSLIKPPTLELVRKKLTQVEND